jgi:hypothetical protein
MGCRRMSTSPSNRRLAAEQGPWRRSQSWLLAMYHKRSPLSPRSLPDSLFGSPLAKVSQKTSMVYTGSSRLLPARTFALYLTRYPRISSDTTSKSSAVAIMFSSKPPYLHREGARMRCLNHIRQTPAHALLPLGALQLGRNQEVYVTPQVSRARASSARWRRRAGPNDDRLTAASYFFMRRSTWPNASANRSAN